MKVFNQGLVVGVMLAMLAGCQSEAVKFAVKDRKVADEVGLKIEWLRDFGQEGVLATQPKNLGLAYSQERELGLRLFRVTNISKENREIYPILPDSGKEARVSVSQIYRGECPRAVSFCPTDTFYSNAELISVYDSEFDIVSADFQFDSGGQETVRFNSETKNPQTVQIRAGESAVFRLRLALHSSTSLMNPVRIDTQGAVLGTSFYPQDLSSGLQPPIFRLESLIGVYLSDRTEISILARNPVTDELNPVYLDRPIKPGELFSEVAASMKIAFPPPQVARRINGLAVQF